MGYTEQMEDTLFLKWGELDASDLDYQGLIDTLNSEDIFRTFGDGLLVFLRRKYSELSEETAVKYIEKCCMETGVLKSDIASINTLKSWFKGGPRPRKGNESRESMFALAFALRLTPEEAAELFHKVYLDRAFDYRNEREIVYYFCLQRKKSWADAKRLIERMDNLNTDMDDYTVRTALIRIDIDAIMDEEALVSYIANHGHNLKKKNVTAKRNVDRLIKKAKETAEAETKLIDRRKHAEEANIPKEYIYADSPEIEHFRNTDARSLNHLYEVITGQSVRGEKGTRTLFRNARLPREIRSRFPEALTLSKKDPTYEELRKLIILLSSYIFWYQVQEKNDKADIDDYREELNSYLDESGLPLMYYGNPYDWLFLYCSLDDRPLDIFRGILAEVLDEESSSAKVTDWL